VVLVTFAGAEGAPPGSRPKGQAKEIADGLLGMARADFHQAVGKGDSGSADDIGRVPRGVLDPAVEAAVFALGPNDVSEVIDTPRGYWIVKRLD
jgi:parvulin-like peptidyl-prolyl isomerase